MYAAMNLMATPPLDSLDLMTGQAALRTRAHDYMQARVVPAQHVLISSAECDQFLQRLDRQIPQK